MNQFSTKQGIRPVMQKITKPATMDFFLPILAATATAMRLAITVPREGRDISSWTSSALRSGNAAPIWASAGAIPTVPMVMNCIAMIATTHFHFVFNPCTINSSLSLNSDLFQDKTRFPAQPGERFLLPHPSFLLLCRLLPVQ